MQEDETEFSPRPPILREEITSEMKTLLADVKYPQLNNFSLLLGLSDRLMGIRGFFSYTSYNPNSLGWTSSYLHLF